MPKKKPQASRVYYSIGEVAKMFNVNTSLIRFWEKEFDVLRPYKNKKGTRHFTQRDVDNLHTIYHLVKERGFTLKGAKDKLRNNPEEVKKDIEIKKTLDKMYAFLQGIKEKL